ncbi:MAG: helix-turn-helix domain-containing protein [Candidatus Nanoarchaeia archaeon]
MISEDSVKDAFSKAKQDIDSIKQETDFLRKELAETRERFTEIVEVLKELSEKFLKFEENQRKLASTHKPENKTVSTHPSTDNTSFKPLKHENLSISIGNQGVPTDKQTNRQTNQHTQKTPKTQENSMEKALEILNSLDNIKKEIRLKFKRLTDQEMLIFSTLYQLGEEKGYTDYKSIAETLSLSESSIRDYIGRLIKKDIPINKHKINNKNIQLSIAENLKKVAPLHTILQLRDL